ncbi:MAG: sigma-70 family RNA polymerase sigma factor [Ruminococcus sp.]|nr:sigma-70 family RNA polymerase sigma factor [Ruminococcus sp.]
MINVYLTILNTDEDKIKFEEMYIKYKQMLFKLSFCILHNKEDAEDAVHQSFLTIANNFEKIKTMSCHEMESYIVIIIRNNSINTYNKNIERCTELDEEQLPIDIDFFEDINYENLVRTISGLSQIYKDVLLLHYVNDFSVKEISKMLDISIDNVRKRLERAKRLLKSELEKGE